MFTIVKWVFVDVNLEIVDDDVNIVLYGIIKEIKYAFLENN